MVYIVVCYLSALEPDPTVDRIFAVSEEHEQLGWERAQVHCNERKQANPELDWSIHTHSDLEIERVEPA